MTTPRRRARTGAAALFEFGIAAIALTVLLSGFIGWKNLNDARRDAIHVADQTQTIAEAIGRYVSDNYQAFQACLLSTPGANTYKYYQLAGDPVPIEGSPTNARTATWCTTAKVTGGAVATFANAALLQQQGVTNEYGQTYMVALRAVPPGPANATTNTYLEGFVYTTGGDAIPDDVLSMASRRSGTLIAFNPINAALATDFTLPAWMTVGTAGVVTAGHLASTLGYAINATAANGQLHQNGSYVAPTTSPPQVVADRRTNTMNASIYFAYRPPTPTVNGGDAATPHQANICFPYMIPGTNTPDRNADGTLKYPTPTPTNPNDCQN